MLPFSVALRPGEPVTDRVIFAVTRAVVSGQLRPGDAFPSVRALSQALKINPNTAHRIVTALVNHGLLTVLPGIGTVVAEGRPHADARRLVLEHDAERLVVGARAARVTLDEVLSAVRQHWSRMGGEEAARRAAGEDT